MAIMFGGREITRRELKAIRKGLAEENLRYGEHLQEMKPEAIADVDAPESWKPKRVWRSKRHSVMLYADRNGFMRLTIQKTEVKDNGNWGDGISWDTMQRLKKEAGFGNTWAVEIFPPEDRVVNVSNMRHLWLMDKKPEFAW